MTLVPISTHAPRSNELSVRSLSSGVSGIRRHGIDEV
jgi:hypothetical protein